MRHTVAAHKSQDNRRHTNVPTQPRTLPTTNPTYNFAEHPRGVTAFSECRENGDNDDEEQNVTNTTEGLKDTEDASEVNVAGDSKNDQRYHEEGGVPGLRHVGCVMEFDHRLYHSGEKNQRGSNTDNPGEHRDPA